MGLEQRNHAGIVVSSYIGGLQPLYFSLLASSKRYPFPLIVYAYSAKAVVGQISVMRRVG